MKEWLAKRHWYAWKEREHPGAVQLLNELRREGRLSAAAWRERQDRRLGLLLEEAWRHVPYYTDLFQRHGLDSKRPALEELPKLPVLTKNIVRSEHERLTHTGLPREHLLPNTTGGSTGSPLSFLQTRFYGALSTALDAYVRESWGVAPYAKTAFIWGADRDLPQWSLRDRFYHWRSRHRLINAFRLAPGDMERFLTMLRSWKPPYLVGYASALDVLAGFAEKHGFGDLRFEAIRSSAEMLWPEQRDHLERVFRSPVYNFYGSREVNNIAAECPGNRKLHLISTWRVLEVVDDDGRPVSPGTPGYLCITDAGNKGMPFIRYLNGDMGTLDPEPCPCGRPTPVLKELIGRSSDVITTPGGEYVHGEFFTHLFYGRDDVRRFQVRQTSLTRLEIKVELEGPEPAAFFASLEAAVRERMGSAVEVHVEVVDEIPVPPSGKHRFTVSDIVPDLLR